MLVIRLQRTGRSGHAQFRLIVQDSRFSPTSGRVVAYVGNYNPHTKEANLDVEKISQYLAGGAQPSPRAIKLLKDAKVKLPNWVSEPAPQKKAVRNPEKRRSTRPEGESEPAPAQETEGSEQPAQEVEPATEAPTEQPVESPAEETATEAPTEEKPVESEAAAKPEAPVEEKPAEPAEN